MRISTIMCTGMTSCEEISLVVLTRSGSRNPEVTGLTADRGNGRTLMLPVIQTDFPTSRSILKSRSHRCDRSLYILTWFAGVRSCLVAGSLPRRARLTPVWHAILSASSLDAAMINKLSLFSFELRGSINRGSYPKTNSDGTSPLGPIVSLRASIAIRSTSSPRMVPSVFSTAAYTLRSGS